MTDPEFVEWWEDFTASFADVGLWLSNLPNAEKVLVKWRSALEGIDAADAWEVTRMMTTGTLQAIGTTDHERAGTGRRVAGEARLVAADRLRRQRFLEGQTKGNESERWYRCRDCLDSGLVRCVNPVHWNARRLIVDDMTYRCRCDAGGKFSAERTTPGGTRYAPMKQFDPLRHFRAMEGITNAVRAEFRVWIRDEERIAKQHEWNATEE